MTDRRCCAGRAAALTATRDLPWARCGLDRRGGPCTPGVLRGWCVECGNRGAGSTTRTGNGAAVAYRAGQVSGAATCRFRNLLERLSSGAFLVRYPGAAGHPVRLVATAVTGGLGRPPRGRSYAALRLMGRVQKQDGPDARHAGTRGPVPRMPRLVLAAAASGMVQVVGKVPATAVARINGAARGSRPPQNPASSRLRAPRTCDGLNRPRPSRISHPGGTDIDAGPSVGRTSTATERCDQGLDREDVTKMGHGPPGHRAGQRGAVRVLRSVLRRDERVAMSASTTGSTGCPETVCASVCGR